MWLGERTSKDDKHRSKKSPSFGICCNHGQVQLPEWPDFPEPLRRLLYTQDEDTIHFRANIRTYNSAIQMASTGAQVDYSSMGSNGNFRISVRVYHCIGPLLPVADQPPKFAQLYLVDSEHELQNRSKLQWTHKMACWCCVLRAADGTVPRGTGNLPKSNEIAVVFPGDGSEPMRNRDIVVRLREGGEADLQYISTLHGADDIEDVKVDPRAKPWCDIGKWRSLEDSIADFKGKAVAQTMCSAAPIPSTNSD
ncbi:hypothetical protein WJX77_003644 [Trebouxia sp. C0004]